MLFPEVPYMERFAQARAAGFAAVESGFVAADPVFPYEYDVDAAAAELRRLGLRQVLFNVPLGDRTRGDRGIAAHPARREEFREGVRRGIDAARGLDCRLLNCLAGLRDGAVPYEEQWACLVDNVRAAARLLEAAGLTLMVEPINTFALPKFFLSCNARRRTSPPRCGRCCRASATCRSPIRPDGTSPGRVNCTSALSCVPSTTRGTTHRS